MYDFDFNDLIVDIPDYPEPGVIFKDVTPLFADPRGFASTIDAISDHFMGRGITKVVAAEARGFLFGAPIAYRLNAGIVPARKPGKLPRETYTESYELEYGSDELQIHTDAISKDDVVLLVDDLIATGGTSVSIARLTQKAGARIEGFAALIELAFLNPRDVISKVSDKEIFSLVKID